MRRLVALLLIVTTTGCYMHTVEVRPWRDEPYASSTTVHFFWGITGATTPAGVCRRGLERATFYMPWWGFLVSLVTVGIVVPTTVDYVCESRSQYENAPRLNQDIPPEPSNIPPGPPPPPPSAR